MAEVVKDYRKDKAVWEYYNHLILNNYTESLDENGEPKQEPAKEQGQNKKAATDGGQEATGKVSNIGSNKASKGGEVVVTGDEFGEYKDIKELRAKAKKYYKEKLQGTSVTNPILGQVNLDDYDVEFTRAGLGKMTATSAKEHKLLLVPHLPELIRTATKITRSDNVKNKRDASQYAYLHTEAIIDGQKQPVVITIFTDVNGNKYYNHILPIEEKGTKSKDSSVPPAQATQESDGIPAIDEPSVTSSIPQGQQEVTHKNTDTRKSIFKKRHDVVTIE